jgi:DsbC/DsbD-like thiol-disulfide interchange protein
MSTAQSRARRFRLAAASAALAAGMALAPAHRAAAATSPWAANPQSQVRLISAWRVAPRSGELRLGLQFRLAPHWHVYWKNSGDAGYAPVVAFARQPGLGYPELLWPAPHRYELAGDLEAFGYEGEVVYPVRATLGAGGTGGPGGQPPYAPQAGQGDRLRLTADVDYLICQVDCVPHRYSLTLDQELGDTPVADPDTAQLLDRWWHEVPLAADRQPGVHATVAFARAAAAVAAPASAAARPAAAADGHGDRPEDDLTLVLQLDGVAAAPGGADLFFETDPVLDLARPRVSATAAGLRFTVPAHRKDASAPLPASTAIAWTATGLRLGGGGTLALAARQQVSLAGPAAPAAATGGRLLPARSAAGGASADTGRGAIGAAAASGSATAAPRALDRIRAVLAARDPRLVGLLAAAMALLTLDLWGLSWRAAGRTSPLPHREALGFATLLVTLGLLYALSLEVSPEGLAGTELALLAMGLLAWLWRRTRRPERAPS